jgi:hypothetical protein
MLCEPELPFVIESFVVYHLGRITARPLMVPAQAPMEAWAVD